MVETDLLMGKHLEYALHCAWYQIGILALLAGFVNIEGGKTVHILEGINLGQDLLLIVKKAGRQGQLQEDTMVFGIVIKLGNGVLQLG